MFYGARLRFNFAKLAPMKQCRTILGAGAVSLALLASPVMAEQLRPFDEGKRDPSFATFRAKLIAAIKRRDLNYVVAQAAPGIRLGFGGTNGRAWFRKHLVGTRALYCNRVKAAASEYRGWLRWVLMNGGGFIDGGKGFVAPYQNAYEARARDCAKSPARKTLVCRIDDFTRAYVLGRGVPLYARPSAKSKIVTRLSYTIIELGKHVEHQTKAGRTVRVWSEVKLEDGQRAYIRPIQYYSALGYRVRFAKHAGRWRIEYFLAGD